MAKTYVITDDLDGSPEAEPYRIAVNGNAITLDLADKSATKLLKALAPFFEKAKELDSYIEVYWEPPSTGARAARKTVKAKTDPEQTRAMREWLRKQGKTVSDRGRIPDELKALYHGAH